jgi:riboflavin synthase
MFTGLVEETGEFIALNRLSEGARLTLRAPLVSKDTRIGDSIAVNGCCLTVTENQEDGLAFDLLAETLRRTNLGALAPGAPVNLERALAAHARLGGHFVQGHVDGVGRVEQLTPQGDNWWLSVRVPPGLDRYLVNKGSVAIDGISLTVAGIAAGVVEAAIIPFTYANTGLQALSAGDAVNLEVDILAKYIERLTEARQASAPSRLTVDRLVEEGF